MVGKLFGFWNVVFVGWVDCVLLLIRNIFLGIRYVGLDFMLFVMLRWYSKVGFEIISFVKFNIFVVYW